MRTPFEHCIAKTDDEYRVMVERRIHRFYAILVIGVITLLLSILNTTTNLIELSDFSDGFYFGVGSGLTVVSILMIIKNKKMLKNEKKLHQDRLANQDERNIMISRKSMNYAAISMLILAYAGMIIFVAKNETTFVICFVEILVFFFVYILSTYILEKK